MTRFIEVFDITLSSGIRGSCEVRNQIEYDIRICCVRDVYRTFAGQSVSAFPIDTRPISNLGDAKAILKWQQTRISLSSSK